MKRGQTGLQSKCPAFSAHEKRANRQKKATSGCAQSYTEDWGNLPHHVVLQIFQHLSLIDRAKASSVCRRWNDVFHTPDLWRRFEFELNQPATSYLRSTHPDLIQQIIKKHAQHLQYVSFKVKVSCCHLFLLSFHFLWPPPPISQRSSSKKQCVPSLIQTTCHRVSHDTSAGLSSTDLTHPGWNDSNTSISPYFYFYACFCWMLTVTHSLVNQVDSCIESAEAACDILSQLVNCTIKTLGLISTARPSFMDVSQVKGSYCFFTHTCQHFGYCPKLHK